jgi:hypothetical protein
MRHPKVQDLGKNPESTAAPPARQMVHVLASLFVLNGPLRDAETMLALGEHVDLQSIYRVAPEEAREMWKRKSSFEGW